MSQRSPFIGRDEELSRIEEAVEAVRNGETRFVVVEGITGSGKASLLREAVRPLTDWPEYGVVLTKDHRDVPAAALQSLMQQPQAAHMPAALPPQKGSAHNSVVSLFLGHTASF